MTERPIDPIRHPEGLSEAGFIADSATVLGAVRMGKDSSVWFGAVVRGDTESIEIGAGSNIQDLAVLHADPGFPCRIGDRVTVGHAAIVHGATVEEGALIGIRAVVLNGAVVGAGAIIGAGAVVPEGREIPPGHLAVGIPARVVRELDDKDQERLRETALHYVDASRAYRDASDASPRKCEDAESSAS